MMTDLFAAAELAGYVEGQKDAHGKFDPILDELKAVRARTDLTERQKRQLIKRLRRPLDAEIKRVEAEHGKLKVERSRLDQLIAGFQELQDWNEGPRVLQAPQASFFHKVLEAEQNGDLLYGISDKERLREAQTWLSDNIGDAQCIVVQHDWAAAFANATDYEGDDYKLPADCCFFEFRISGHQVATLKFADSKRECLFWNSRNGWIVVTTDPDNPAPAPDEPSDRFMDLLAMVHYQIKAICVALDAEVATREVVRAPHRLNHAREKSGKPLVRDYHVVHLNRRYRTALPTGEHTGTRKRLHFRRGHWRHYEQHKTWIRWTLVGNPDLGWIDKEYRA